MDKFMRYIKLRFIIVLFPQYLRVDWALAR